MAETVQFSIYVEPEIKSALDALKDAEGIPLGVQVRFALLAWLESKGYGVKALKKRAG